MYRGNKLTAERPGTITRAILSYIRENNGATKYDIVTNVLGKRGSRKDLRGYYSVFFSMAKNSGLLSYDSKTYNYHITEKGYNALAGTKDIYTPVGAMMDKLIETKKERETAKSGSGDYVVTPARMMLSKSTRSSDDALRLLMAKREDLEKELINLNIAINILENL